MDLDMNTPRLLGAAVLIVFFASLLSEQLLKSVIGSGSISNILVNISENTSRLLISNLVALVNSLGIIFLAAMLYIALNKHNQIIAFVALGWWLAEAITLAFSKIGAFALIPLSQKFVAAGAPEESYFQTMGKFLYHGVDRQGYNIHMLFFCMGGILWYYLLHISGNIPPALSIWGLVAICLFAIPTLLALLDLDYLPAMILGLPYAPFELVLGVWLIFKGFN